MTYKSKFGFGCMRLPLTDEKDPTSIDQELFNQMVDIYMEKGFNYFDTSYAYHNGTSELAIRKAVVERYPRESFKICDKMPTWALTSEEDNEKVRWMKCLKDLASIILTCFSSTTSIPHGLKMQKRQIPSNISAK